MIIPISIREGHPDDIKIERWYKGLIKSERSRKIREILLAYIEGNQHIVRVDKKETRRLVDRQIKMVDLVGEGVEEDLDSRLNSLGGFM